MEKTFEDGLWYAIQELVLHYNESGIAAELARNENLRQEQAIALQEPTEYENARMFSFIKANLKP